MEYVVKQPLRDCIVTARLENSHGVFVFDIGDTDSQGVSGIPRVPGKYHSVFLIPGHLLSPGPYYITVGAGILGRLAYEVIDQSVTLEVLEIRPVQPTTRRKPGIISPMIKWHTTEICERE